MCFSPDLRNSRRPSDTEAHLVIHELLKGSACRTHARDIIKDIHRSGLGFCLRFGMAFCVRRKLRNAALGSATSFRRRGGLFAGCVMRPVLIPRALGAGKDTTPERNLPAGSVLAISARNRPDDDGTSDAAIHS